MKIRKSVLKKLILEVLNEAEQPFTIVYVKDGTEKTKVVRANDARSALKKGGIADSDVLSVSDKNGRAMDLEEAKNP